MTWMISSSLSCTDIWVHEVRVRQTLSSNWESTDQRPTSLSDSTRKAISSTIAPPLATDIKKGVEGRACSSTYRATYNYVL